MFSSLCRIWQQTTFMIFGAKPMSLREMRLRLHVLVSCPESAPWALLDLAHWHRACTLAAIHQRYVVCSPHIVVSTELFRRSRPEG